MAGVKLTPSNYLNGVFTVRLPLQPMHIGTITTASDWIVNATCKGIVLFGKPSYPCLESLQREAWALTSCWPLGTWSFVFAPFVCLLFAPLPPFFLLTIGCEHLCLFSVSPLHWHCHFATMLLDGDSDDDHCGDSDGNHGGAGRK